MKFRYIIFDVGNGMHYGTNDNEKALSYAQSEDHWVVDAQEGKQIWSGGEVDDLQELG